MLINVILDSRDVYDDAGAAAAVFSNIGVSWWREGLVE
jgi:hypothetical protein